MKKIIVSGTGCALTDLLYADVRFTSPAFTRYLSKHPGDGRLTAGKLVFTEEFEQFSGKPWPLGKSDESFGLTDVLIMDQEEAKRISGKNTSKDIIEFFIEKRVSSFFITNGAKDLVAYSDGRLFEKSFPIFFPVSRMVTDELRKQGDTTGCGDNFAGGIIASLAQQIMTKDPGQFNLKDEISLAVASGAFACKYLGGTYHEIRKGEKRQRIEEFLTDYRDQIKMG